MLKMILINPTTTLFPYTTLFRSVNPPRPGRRDRFVVNFHKLRPALFVRIDNHRGRQSIVFERDRDTEIEGFIRSEEHTSELQSRLQLVCRLLFEKKTLEN